jgi:peptide deformylase
VSVLPIRMLGDPVLRERARPVETFDELLKRLYEDMLETMYKAPGVGLAAPQVGLSLAFFVYDAGDGSGPGGMANPALSELDGEGENEEGCLSIPGLWHPTARALHARADGLDVEGRPVTVVGEGLLARILQHETDHLNGMLFIDRLSEAERRHALAELRERELEPPAQGRLRGSRR